MRTNVVINSPAQIAQSKVAGKLAAEVLAMIGEHVKAGVTTDQLDQICHDYIVLGQLLVKNGQSDQRNAHHEHREQGIPCHQASVRPGKPVEQRMEGGIEGHGVLIVFLIAPA